MRELVFFRGWDVGFSVYVFFYRMGFFVGSSSFLYGFGRIVGVSCCSLSIILSTICSRCSSTLARFTVIIGVFGVCILFRFRIGWIAAMRRYLLGELVFRIVEVRFMSEELGAAGGGGVEGLL